MLFLALGLPVAVPAAALTVSVVDRDGKPLPNVAVYLDVADADAALAENRKAVMDQVDTRFDPHLLVVQAGTRVEFPNSDLVAHHVYSFSKPNDFMLPLYKGDAHAPVRFEQAGLVTLGCNIHDQMLAFILVVNSNVFGVTDQYGRVSLDTGQHHDPVISIWSPRIKTGDEELTKNSGNADVLEFRLKGKLRPDHDSQHHSVKWSDY